MRATYQNCARLAALCGIGLIVVFSAGCSGAGAAQGDAARGQQLFSGERAFANANSSACSMCHGVDPSQGIVLGPNLSGIGRAAATRVAGQTAEDYLRTSILNPDAYLAEGFQEGIMPRTYEKMLTRQEISDLVAYLLTLQ